MSVRDPRAGSNALAGHDSLGRGDPRAQRVLTSALAAAGSWLLEPAESNEPEVLHPLERRPVVAVIGLGSRCGTTTVARALGAEIAADDPAAACVVTAGAMAGPVPLGLPAAGRLSRRIAPLVGARTQSCGRLCLVEAPDRAALADAARYLAPLLLDVQEPAEAAVAAALADHVVLVAPPDAEPALADVVAESLRGVGPEPVVVLNRAGRAGVRWAGRSALKLPDTRLGAQLALCGREPRGALGRAIAELATHMPIR